MKSTIKSAFAITAAALMVMVAVVPMVGVFQNSGSDAADSEYVDDVVIKIFEADDDLSDLVYYSNSLPKTMDPAEWALETHYQVANASKTWYNINKNSDDYGKILTFGMAGITNDQAKAMIIAALGENAFPLVYVTWTQLIGTGGYNATAVDKQNIPAPYASNNLNNYIQILKDGTPITVGDKLNYYGYPLVRGEAALSSKAYFADGVQSMYLGLFSDNTEITTPALSNGTYSVKLFCGNPEVTPFLVGEASVKYDAGGDDNVYVYGTVKDNSGAVITGATVKYKVTTDGQATTGEAYVAATASPIDPKQKAGEFYIPGPAGSTFEVTDVTAPGFVFENTSTVYNKSWSYGTVNADITTGTAYHIYNANAGTIQHTISFKSANSTPKNLDVINYEVAIYYGIRTGAGTPEDPHKYNYTQTAPAGITAGAVNKLTSVLVDGTATISFTKASGTYSSESATNHYLGAFLYVKAVDTTPFTFKYNVTSFTNLAAEISSTQTYKGDKWIANDSVASDSTVLNSLEIIGQVVVEDAAAAYLSTYATVTTQYYYQKQVTGGYEFTTSTPAGITGAKLAMLYSGVSNYEDGKAYFAYIAPTISAEAAAEGWTAYIYLSAANIDLFTFTKSEIKNGASSFMDLVAVKDGDTGYATATEPTFDKVIKANEIAVKVTLTLTVPKIKTTGEIAITHTNSITAGDTLDIAYVDWSEASPKTYNYEFYTIKGNSPEIKIVCDGYTVKTTAESIDWTAGYTLPTVTAPVTKVPTFALKAAKTFAPTAMGTYKTGEAATAGLVTTYVYTIGTATSDVKEYEVDIIGGTPSLVIYGTGVEVPEVVAGSTTGNSVVFDGPTPVTVKSYTFATFKGASTLANLYGGVEFALYSGAPSAGTYIGSFETTTEGYVTVLATSGLNANQFRVVVNGITITPSDASAAGFTDVYAIDFTAAIIGGETHVVSVSIPAEHAAHVSISRVGNNIDDGTVITLVADNEYYDDVSGVAGSATITEKNVFKGWYADGVLISANPSATYVVLDDVVISAVYETQLIDSTPAAVELKQGIDSTTLIIGIVAIVIALIAVAFVIISIKKKEA